MSTINTAEFSWAHIAVTAMGRTFERILNIEYDKEREKKYIYGRGSEVKGIQRQNKKPSAKMTLGQSEIEAMIRASKTGELTDLVMDIQVHYIDEEGGEIVRDRIIGAEFTKAPKGMKQGDSDMEVTLDIMCKDIKYNQ